MHAPDPEFSPIPPAKGSPPARRIARLPALAALWTLAGCGLVDHMAGWLAMAAHALADRTVAVTLAGTVVAGLASVTGWGRGR